MFLKPIYFIAILALFLSTTIKGSQLAFNNLTADQGLPHNSVWKVSQDLDGFIWILTTSGIVRYDGYNLRPMLIPGTDDSESPNHARDIYFDNLGNAWVATMGGGIWKYSNNRFEKLNSNIKEIYQIKGNSDVIFAKTKNKLFYKTAKQQSFIQLKIPFNVLHISRFDDDYFLINSKSAIYKLSTKTLKFEQLSLPKTLESIRKSFYINGHVFVSTNDNLHVYSLETKEQYTIDGIFNQSLITDMSSTESGPIYVATFDKGLVQLTNSFGHYEISADSNNYLVNGQYLASVFIDKQANIWVGTFGKGVSKANIHNLNWGLNHSTPAIKCIATSNLRYVSQHKDSLFLSSKNKFIAFNMATKTCNKFQPAKKKSNNSFFVNDIYYGRQTYVSTTWGLYTLSKDELIEIPLPNPTLRVSSIIEIESGNTLLIATNKGAYVYNIEKDSFLEVTFPKATNVYTFNIARSKIYITTDTGLYLLQSSDPNNPIASLANPSDEFLNANIYTSHFDEAYFFITNLEGKILKYNYDLQRVDSHDLSQNKLPTLAQSINFNNPFLWATTNKGIIKYNVLNKDSRQYQKSDGLQGNDFIRQISTFKNNKIIAVGSNGFNAFYPEDIKDNLVPPKVALTKLTRFNKEVVAGEDYEGFSIDKPIEYLDELEIGHRDYVIGFEFAGLHYADPMRNQYQYMLEGFHEDWVSTDAKNRTATFTNLSPGDYVFRVKAANKDGVWSLDEDNVALKIRVHPAPWLSWWAFMIYGLLILGSILWFIRYRTQAAIARARELEQEVSVRTKEIETQKNVIESLLERKNELFANISHEFRTPLTLILGPLEKELKALDSPKNPKHLQMIQRNATRLLGMVEQILKLTELKKEDTVNKVPHAVNPALEAIVESFSSLAESKQMELTLDLDENVNVMAANDALEVMVGNLVSNAIKYTPDGGKVFVTSKLVDNTIQIQVTDTGVGMTKAQQEDVFERFVRLDKTSDIAGTGIGLSIVKELILAHHGQVQVDSIEGQGSAFTINLPTTEQAALSDTHSIKAIEHLTQGEAIASEVTQATDESLTETQQELVLIIDDNPDMRDYIQEVLAPNYHCITADRGEPGIELAKAQVPDLIICDIMMPGIDGYEVAKRLRDDIITSHIPIVLLTAKGDKESRIQGWNENIDDYMTKPFDEEELRARVSNIIDIRHLLSLQSSELNKTDRTYNENSFWQSLETHSLSKRDQQFINSLINFFDSNYSNQELKRIQIAENLHISERQLSRKIKALFNTTPMSLLKQLRIDKAKQLLINGETVSDVSEMCGFNELSYFSQCFTISAGKSPKEFVKERKRI